MSQDEWHTVEVGVPLVFIEGDDKWTEQQVTVNHGTECPRETISHGEVDGTKVLEILFRCNLAIDAEFYGLNDWITESLGLEYGVWRVRAYATRDYWGEYDLEYDIERLHGAVDEREFEKTNDRGGNNE